MITHQAIFVLAIFVLGVAEAESVAVAKKKNSPSGAGVPICGGDGE